MNAQDIFDTVVTHLYRQGHRSINNDKHGACAYRGDNGNSCAVGCLIADEAYSKQMESQSVLTISLLLPTYLRDHIDLLKSLQNAHDWSDWRPGVRVNSLTSNLRKVAKRHGLQFRTAFYPKSNARRI